ncbi:terminase [Lactobacillus paragasseri]|uniref:terminase n=1 Tax=Lactobacillus paragasseri TaxID=2107999 RepID=UPI0029C37F96|nr:terminase [Lactobacillus paragasseri]MDX5080173.1 terminase [Lactobacillus paragasseri]
MARAEYKKWLEPDNLTRLRSWARDGLTNEQIAKKIGVRRQTISEWSKKYPDIADALKKGKEVVDSEIEDSLISVMKKHTITTTQYKMVKKDDFNLKAERSKFANVYKLDHPNATKNEILIATAENVEVYEKIPISKTVTEVDPNTSAIIFWLKNRRPDVYRDQTFQKLNEANARKTLAEAQLSEAQLKAIEESDDPSNKTIIVDDIREVSNDSNSETESRD